MSAVSLHLEVSHSNGRVYTTVYGRQVDVTDVSVAELTRMLGADLCGRSIAPLPSQVPASGETHARPTDVSTCPQFVTGVADSEGEHWCGRCYGLCESSAWGVVASCGHRFHESCLQKHLNATGEAHCPICNRDLEQACKRIRVGH